jgi:hypothetical protein
MSDCDIINSDECTSHDLGDIFKDIFKTIPLKMAIFIFILFLIIRMPFFEIDMIGKIDSKFIHEGILTRSGILIQGLFLAVVYIILSMLNEGGLI